MAITNFIPTIWSENLYKQLDGKYVAVANCTREWEGDIKKCGDRVRICGVGPISVFDYTKNSNINSPVALNEVARELVINQAKAFNFQIDDVDRAQTSPKIMDQALRNAANALANEADKYVFSQYAFVSSDNTIKVDSISAENIMDTLLAGVLKLQTNGVSDDLVLEVSPAIASIILKAKINLSSDNSDAIENGCIGSVAGCKIFVSNNVNVSEGGSANFHKCFMRTKRAIAFAEQLSEVEAYRPELRFADAVKGLHLYGAKIVYSNEIVLLDLGIAA